MGLVTQRLHPCSSRLFVSLATINKLRSEGQAHWHWLCHMPMSSADQALGLWWLARCLKNLRSCTVTVVTHQVESSYVCPGLLVSTLLRRCAERVCTALCAYHCCAWLPPGMPQPLVARLLCNTAVSLSLCIGRKLQIVVPLFLFLTARLVVWVLWRM